MNTCNVLIQNVRLGLSHPLRTWFRHLAGFCCGLLFAAQASVSGQSITCWFAPEWKTKTEQAKKITDALSAGAAAEIKPRIAESYPQILSALSAKGASMVYVGSFIQATLVSRGKVVPLVQGVDGREMYSGVMIYPKGGDPAKILEESPEPIAYAVSASSGESSAKAATHGKASLGVVSHQAAINALLAGKAKAAFVKNTWWNDNRTKYATLDMWRVPGISEEKNPDNILSASTAVPEVQRQKIAVAAIAAKDAFGMKEMVPCDTTRLNFSLDLMKRAQIDPFNYEWK